MKPLKPAEPYRRHMPLSNELIPGTYVRHLVDKFVAEGVELNALLQGSKLSHQEIMQSDGQITFEQQLQVYKNAAKLQPSPAFGLQLGHSLRRLDHGVLGYAVYCSADLRQAIRVTVEFQRIAGSMLRMEMFEQGDKLCITFSPVDGLGDAEIIASDEVLAVMGSTLLQLSLPTTLPKEIQLKHTVTDLAPYEQMFGCNIVPNAGITTLVINESDARRKLAMADTEVASVCAAKCRDLLRRYGAPADIVDEVRRILVTQPRAGLSLDRVAEMLHMSGRSLRRKLQASDTNFRQVRDEVLCGIALDYLQTSELPLDEIADLLGYNEVVNFYRAFRRWTGKSPGEVRTAG